MMGFIDKNITLLYTACNVNAYVQVSNYLL